MSRRHYQVMILGDSLAARLAGTLLAKRGCSILSFPDGALGGSWFHSSWLLEKILEDLAGRSCYAVPVPFQVITRESRLEFQGDSPLEEELRREFPASHGQVSTLLHRLAETGEQLEGMIWGKTPLPLYGFSSRLAFAWKAIRGRLRSSLNQPLQTLFADLKNDPSWSALNALFSGLALAPADRLSAAEGALLWSSCTRSRSVSLPGLDTLLRHRYEQYNGASKELDDVVRMQLPGKGPASVFLRNGSECSADHLLLGNAGAFSLLPEETRGKLAQPLLPDIFSVAVPEELASPLLAPRIILEGTPSLRISLTSREGQIQGTVEGFRAKGTPLPETAALKNRLSALFPFTEINPVLQKEGTPAPVREPRPFLPTEGETQRIGSGIIYCQGAGLFPALGAAGEVLLGFSTARFLASRLKLPR